MTGAGARQADVNATIWRSGHFLAEYDRRSLEPAEVLILVRHRDAFCRRVLDVGCGAGRILGYLVRLEADAHGVDISERMVEHCRRRFPEADVRVGDLGRLGEAVEGPFDVILLSDNVLDVFDDARRRQVLADVRTLLMPGGLLVFSSHNLTAVDTSPPTGGRAEASWWSAVIDQLNRRPLLWLIRSIVRLPRRRANRQRLAPLEHRGADHAVINDAAHDYSLLHYYISRRAQEGQLHELGYRLLEVLEFDGTRVADGEDGRGGSLYYVATPA